MKITAPENIKTAPYFTVGKSYEVQSFLISPDEMSEKGTYLVNVLNDFGVLTIVRTKHCAHLYNADWKVSELNIVPEVEPR